MQQTQFTIDLPIDKILEICTCAICNKIIDFPISVSCGALHTFCKLCISNYYKINCPVCACQFSTREINIPLQQIINALIINCKNCEWRGLVENYKHHMKKQCDNNLISCKYCKQQIIVKNKKDHYELCEFFEIMCNDCGVKIPRIKIVSHKNICRLRKIQCVN